MELLEKLEKKILLVVENNKQLKTENEAIKKELLEAENSHAKIESALLRENSSVDTLSKEKDAIKIAIEALLSNIDKLEEIKD